MASEVTLTLVLLCGAGLLTRGFYHLLNQEWGFDASNVLTLSLARPEGDAPEAAFERILQEVRALSRVEAAAAASPLPFGHGTHTDCFHAEGTPDPGRGRYTGVRMHDVTPGYFRTLGMRLLEGRWFTSTSFRPSAVINEALARKAWPGRNPVGRRFRLGTPVPDSDWLTVVGVVADTREDGHTSETAPEIYLPTTGAADLLVRAAGDPSSLAPAIRARVHSVDRSQAIYDICPLEERISESVRGYRTLAWLLGIFAGIAVLLAAVGIYAVISHAVNRRTQELGVRIAVGALPADVRNLVLGQGMLPVLAGMAVGVPSALGATRLLESFLFGVEPGDPLTYVAVVSLLGGIALLACYIPARRATRVDPTEALRYE